MKKTKTSGWVRVAAHISLKCGLVVLIKPQWSQPCVLAQSQEQLYSTELRQHPPLSCEPTTTASLEER